VCGTPFLAGSGVFTDACLAWLLRLGELSLAEALGCASHNPRRLLGLPEVDLVPGSAAELVLFDRDESSVFRVRRLVTSER
jgi:N-acetylglucosamine-6-phosphate deacetylase